MACRYGLAMYDKRLRRLATRAEQLGPDVDSETRTLAALLGWAAVFDYQVNNGGFDHLLYHVPYDRLVDVEAMLRAVGAPVALAYYGRAVAACAADPAGYQELKATFTARTDLDTRLFELSLEYLTRAVSFPTRSSRGCRRPRRR